MSKTFGCGPTGDTQEMISLSRSGEMGLAGRVTGTAADAGKGALVFGLSLESAARRLAASMRQI